MWTHVAARGLRPAARLICFAPAVMTARFISTWTASSPRDIELLISRPPWVGDSADARRTRDAVCAGADSSSVGGTPTAIFGHDVGTIRAFEAARRLNQEGIGVAALFVASFPAPQLL